MNRKGEGYSNLKSTMNQFKIIQDLYNFTQQPEHKHR